MDGSSFDDLTRELMAPWSRRGEAPFEGSCNGNPHCSCFIKEGGERCGTRASDCGTCTTTEQCAAFGVGVVCVVPIGTGCDCGVGQGFCITPCAS